MLHLNFVRINKWYMYLFEYMIDPSSYAHNFRSCEIKA